MHVFGSKLAVAYYLVPATAALGNALWVVGPELALPVAARAQARLTPAIEPASRCIRWEAVEGRGAAPARGRLRVRVGLTNCGDRVWPDDVWAGPVEPRGNRAVHLGARWILAGSLAAPTLDWRGGLPHAVLPGGRLNTTLYVPAPTTPGRYVLEIDVVQEHVAWFSDSGAKPLRLGVDVK